MIGNPKAILFYMGALPGFFTLSTLTPLDIALIILVSAAIPMAGNLALGELTGRPVTPRRPAVPASSPSTPGWTG